MRYAIGVDLGATNYRLGVVSEDGNVIKSIIDSVGLKREPEDIIRLIGKVANTS